MSNWKWFFGIVNGFSLLLIFVWIAVTVPTEDMDFYRKEYVKYNIAQSIGVAQEDLMEVTEYLVNYMMGRNDDLVIYVTVNEETREFFNQKEKDHMLDVRDLFTAGRKILMVFIVFFVLTTTWFLINRDHLRILAKSQLIVALSFLLTVIILTSLIATNFERAFTMFHEIFFSNDLWILNPQTDLLINIVPLEFFIDISVMVGCILGMQLLFVIVASNMFLKRKHKHGN